MELPGPPGHCQVHRYSIHHNLSILAQSVTIYSVPRAGTGLRRTGHFLSSTQRSKDFFLLLRGCSADLWSGQDHLTALERVEVPLGTMRAYLSDSDK